MKERLEKFIISIICCFVRDRRMRRLMRKLRLGGYDINGTGNQILVKGLPIPRFMHIPGLNIIINGNNNTVKVLRPIGYKASTINIGNDDVYVELGWTNRFWNSTINCCWGHGQRVVIGHGTTFSGNVQIFCDEESGVIIENECKISTNVQIWASDGHSILDKDTGEVTNAVKGYITIGFHTWICSGARITKNARLAPHTIVGGGAVAYKDYQESHVIISGNPGKIIKRNTTWEHLSPYMKEQKAKGHKNA